MNRQEFLATCKARGRSALAAALVGAVVSGFYAVAQWPKGNPLATIVIGSIIGIFVYTFIAVLERYAGPPLDRLGPTPHAQNVDALLDAVRSAGGALEDDWTAVMVERR